MFVSVLEHTLRVDMFYFPLVPPSARLFFPKKSFVQQALRSSNPRQLQPSWGLCESRAGVFSGFFGLSGRPGHFIHADV